MSLWVLCQSLFYGIIAINTAVIIVNNAQGRALPPKTGF